VLRRIATIVAAAGLTLGLAAPPAFAPKYILGASAFGDCATTPPSRFQGSFTVTSFGSARGRLLANATLVGTCAAGLTTVATVPVAPYVFPVVSVAGSCDATHAVVQVRPGAAVVGGFLGEDAKTGAAVRFPVTLSSTVAERSWTVDEPRSVRARICAMAIAARYLPLPHLAPLLNALVLG
jgi:hypothetical protein